MGFAWIIVIVIFALPFVLIGSLIYLKVRKSRFERVKERYEKALRGNSRPLAIQAGLEYYSLLSEGGIMTKTEQQRMQKDIDSFPKLK